MDEFKDRLNKIIPRITSDDLLQNKGLGNEIGFYIFDYPPEKELEMRTYIQFILTYVKKKRPELTIRHINLFELIIAYLERRKLLGKALKMQQKGKNLDLLKALKAPLSADKISHVFVEEADLENCDLVLVSGVGSLWPLMRSHNLLNNLHPLMGDTPLVMFYPGRFTGQGLRLFDKLNEINYYRAFQLVP